LPYAFQLLVGQLILGLDGSVATTEREFGFVSIREKVAAPLIDGKHRRDEIPRDTRVINPAAQDQNVELAPAQATDALRGCSARTLSMAGLPSFSIMREDFLDSPPLNLPVRHGVTSFSDPVTYHVSSQGVGESP